MNTLYAHHDGAGRTALMAVLASLTLSACGGGSSNPAPPDPPAPARLISATNMVEVAAMARYERQQSALVANGYRLLPLWFSTGQDGNATVNCSGGGSVNYQQQGSSFSLTANGCKQVYAGREYQLSSGQLSSAPTPGGASDDYTVSYKDWLSSLQNPLASGAMNIQGEVAQRSSGASAYTRTATYTASRGSVQYSITFTDNLEVRQQGQGFGEVLVSSAITLKNAKFTTPLKISLPSGAPADNSNFFAGTLTISASDGSTLSLTKSGAGLLLELRPDGSGAPSTSKTITAAELDAAVAALF